jgi:hypothetical protein
MSRRLLNPPHTTHQAKMQVMDEPGVDVFHLAEIY